MKYRYKTSQVCSSEINFDIEGNVIKNISFVGGCNGNLKGISALVEGKEAEEVIKTISGITCGFKSTSCPDQLARALNEALNS